MSARLGTDWKVSISVFCCCVFFFFFEALAPCDMPNIVLFLPNPRVLGTQFLNLTSSSLMQSH